MKIQQLALLLGFVTGVHGFTSLHANHFHCGILRSDRIGASRSAHDPLDHQDNNHVVTDRRMEAAAPTTLHRMMTPMATAVLVFSLSCATASAAADFAKKDISGMDFSGQDLSNKDFTSAVARNTNFHNANLQGAKFTKADLEKADFSGASLQSADFADAALDGATFKDAVAERAKFSASILDVGDLENVDLTDSLWPSKCKKGIERVEDCYASHADAALLTLCFEIFH